MDVKEGGYIPLRSPFRADAFSGPEGAPNRSDTTDAELEANAQLIVTAVNNHARLVAALENLKDYAAGLELMLNAHQIEFNDGGQLQVASDALNRVREERR